MIHEKYEAVIGLEVHAQLNTQTKLFCNDSISFGNSANTQVSAVSLAHPGTLPKMNKEVMQKAIALGLAMNCTITEKNYFARKHYFYPDLPKAYQISQHTSPICTNGYIDIETSNGTKKVLINRIHIEEDAGKSTHDLDEHNSLIDLNRAGTPLLEIVTEPCIHDAETAANYFAELRKLVRWINICDGNMDEGSMRCDANISIRLKGEQKLGTKVEVKNINSIKFVKKAIELELERLVDMMENNQTIVQQTRGFNPDANTTYAMRTKEDADDYRYFTDPDIPYFLVTEKDILQIKQNLPALPNELKIEWQKKYNLTTYDAEQLTDDVETAEYFTECTKYSNQYKAISNWIIGPLRNYCNENKCKLQDILISKETLAEIIERVGNGIISFQNASTKLFPFLIANDNTNVDDAIAKLNIAVNTDTNELENWVKEVLAEMPDKVKEYKSGKKGLIGLFSGQVKKKSRGKADMKLVNEMLIKFLDE